MSWPPPKKNVFWSSIFSYSTWQQTISQLDCDVQQKVYFLWQPAQLLDREEAPKHSQSQSWTKKRSWSLFGGLPPVWSTATFWILTKPLHLKSMLSKSMRFTENCNACSWHWSTERAWVFSMTTHNHTSHNQCFKSWTNWTTKFCLIHFIHLTSYQLTTFCRENASTTIRRGLPWWLRQ